MTVNILCDEWDEYELLDSGYRRKLERFGSYIVIREETKAWWQPDLPEHEWKQAVALHSGNEKAGWQVYKKIPDEWLMRFDNLTFQARFTATSKHVGVFPEQLAHWRWMQQMIRTSGRSRLRLLNLFAYTGVASLVAAAEGCEVTHVDSAKGVVNWAKENQRLSNLKATAIRWIVDDTLKFTQREGRRNRKYDAIILDPPSFGRGPKKELWKVEHKLVELLSACRHILSDVPLFVLATMYSIDQSAILIQNVLRDMMEGCGGTITVGELALKPKQSNKTLALSIFGRWIGEKYVV